MPGSIRSELENESLERWIAVSGPTIESQFARSGLASQRPTDMPLTTAALEQITRHIATVLYHDAMR